MILFSFCQIQILYGLLKVSSVKRRTGQTSISSHTLQYLQAVKELLLSLSYLHPVLIVEQDHILPTTTKALFISDLYDSYPYL